MAGMELFEVKENELGKCVFATALIRKGEEIFRFTGSPMQYDETKELGTEESFALQISTNFYLYLDEPARYFNHSCDPNCGLTPDLKLMAIREIAKGEELTYDYSTTMLERDWHLKCKCNKEKCRKVVVDFDRLPKVTQQYYLGLNVVQGFIQDRLAGN
jgi:SET domain-containing protein